MLPGMILVFAGGLGVWWGFTDPEGGILQALKNVIDGKPADANAKTRATARQTATFSGIVSQLGLAGPEDGGGTVTASTGKPGSGANYQDPIGEVPGSTPGGDRVTAEAMRYLGVKYVYGGRSKKGFDCAGLVHYVGAAFGLDLAWYVGGQKVSKHIKRVAAKDRKAGDIVFYGSHHVAIYMGDNKVIHAPHPGTVVRIEGNMGNTSGPITYGRLQIPSKGKST